MQTRFKRKTRIIDNLLLSQRVNPHNLAQIMRQRIIQELAWEMIHKHLDNIQGHLSQEKTIWQWKIRRIYPCRPLIQGEAYIYKAILIRWSLFITITSEKIKLRLPASNSDDDTITVSAGYTNMASNSLATNGSRKSTEYNGIRQFQCTGWVIPQDYNKRSTGSKQPWDDRRRDRKLEANSTRCQSGPSLCHRNLLRQTASTLDVTLQAQSWQH